MSVDDSPTPLSLAVGDRVVYGFHGVGLVVAEGSGPTEATIVLEFTSGLRVTLPFARAQESLRAVSDDSDLARVERTLGAAESAREPLWSKRFRAAQQKLTDGQVIGLAEVVREGAHRESRRLLQAGSTPSPAERELYRRARRLLVEEVSAARGIDEVDADNWITEQIDAKAVE